MKRMFCLVAAPKSFQIALPEPMQPSYRTELQTGQELSLYHHFANKPVNDSFLDINENGFDFCEGILLSHNPQNLKAILREGKHSDIATIHGQFSCMHFDKNAQELRVYTNVSNNMRVYYYHEGGTMIVASSLRLIIALLKANGIPCHPDELGMRMQLTYGFMLKNYTSIAEIRRIGAASILRYKDGELSVQPYFRYTIEPRYHDYKKCADDLTELYTTAVRNGINRDGQQRHFAFLSGGLDSRLTVYTIHKLKTKNVDILNFSQPGYLDQTLSKKISDLLGYNYSFFSLGGGEYLKNIDDVLDYHEGQNAMHGGAHLYAAIRSVDLSKYGVMHSGLMGEMIKGAFLDGKKQVPVNFMTGAYSTKLLHTLVPDIKNMASDYVNNEHFLLENRGFNGMTNGDLACLNLSYSVSPNLDPAFMQYTLYIDPAMRYGARMQLYWTTRNYPEAAKLPWDKFNSPINTPYWLAYLRYYLWRGTNRIKNTLTGQENQLNMNPFKYWWATNPSLRQHFEPKFRVPETLVPLISKELLRDINLMFSEGTFGDKLLGYTAVRSLEYLLG